MGPLHWCMCENAQDLFVTLLKAGADKDLPTSHYRETPLHVAAKCENTFFLEILLRESRSLNAQDIEWNTPLHAAVLENRVPAVRMLLEFKADTTIKNRYEETPYDVAVKQDRLAAAELLEGLPGSEDKLGLAFHSAYYKQPTRLEYLLHHGLPPGAQNTSGKTLLEAATNDLDDYEQDDDYAEEKLRTIQVIQKALA